MRRNFFELLTLIPISVLLSLSFFVLVVVRKVEGQALKIFGYVVAVLFWIAAALVFSTGIFLLSAKQPMRYPMMQRMMHGQMPEMMMHGQMQEKMQQPSMSNK